MKGIVIWVLKQLGIGKEETVKVRIPGDRTEQAKGRSKRLKAEHERKEAQTRTGNKSSE